MDAADEELEQEMKDDSTEEPPAEESEVDEEDVESVFKAKNCTLEEALRNSDCVVLHTYHKAFQKLQITDIKGLMRD